MTNGFPRWGGTNPCDLGKNLLFGKTFAKNCMKLDWEEEVHPPLGPTMQNFIGGYLWFTYSFQPVVLEDRG